MNKKGGVTIPIFHCVFNVRESITSYMRSFDKKMYQELDNFYLICISLNDGAKKEVVAGIAVKTSYKHDEPGFLDAIHGLLLSTQVLEKYAAKNISFLPAKIIFEGLPPSENELLELMQEQYLKHSTGGSA